MRKPPSDLRRSSPAVLPMGDAPAPVVSSAVARLHDWYRGQARDLPWRRTRDPYAIWISEVMLQQTQVATVVPYYERWLARFPRVADLAAADEAEVLRHWQGLGYYRRARHLHRAAQVIVAEHRGVLPRDRVALARLPGVGAYTVAAVLSIADGQALAVVDGNVRRVLARLLALDVPPDRGAGAAAVQHLADALLWRADPGLHNQAVMELGARICSPRAPRCDVCPLAGACEAQGQGAPERYPPRRPKRVVPHRRLAVAVLVVEGRVLLHQRPYQGLLGGLWDLPTVPLSEADGLAAAAQRRALRTHLRQDFGLAVRVGPALEPVPHAFTHLRVTLYPYRCAVAAAAGGALSACSEPQGHRTARWIAWAELGAHALPRATQKVLAQLEAAGGRVNAAD